MIVSITSFLLLLLLLLRVCGLLGPGDWLWPGDLGTQVGPEEGARSQGTDCGQVHGDHVAGPREADLLWPSCLPHVRQCHPAS